MSGHIFGPIQTIQTLEKSRKSHFQTRTRPKLGLQKRLLDALAFQVALDVLDALDVLNELDDNDQAFEVLDYNDE